MANIRLDLQLPIKDGETLTFRSPADCSQVTELTVYYPQGDETVSKTFQFADSHGNNVGGKDLFTSNVLVKVIVDVTTLKAYVQNADTNAYLEAKLAEKYSPTNKPTPSDIGASPTTHNQAASTITAGTFAGQVTANANGQSAGTSLLRNSKLVPVETIPTVNGEICWTYE